jgi:hypothetical protein
MAQLKNELAVCTNKILPKGMFFQSGKLEALAFFKPKSTKDFSEYFPLLFLYL